MSPRPQYHLWPAVARSGSSSAQSTSSDRTVLASGTAPDTEPTAAHPRNASTTPVNPPTDPNSIGILPVSRWSISTRTSTIQGRAEKPSTSPPSKSNNYWGFCAGAWTIRADEAKGLALRVIPSGLWNTQEVWECRCCSFRDSAFVSAKHGKEKEKESTIVDPRIHVSGCGVRYRWIFLAKSHVKGKAVDSLVAESKYGCIICSLEGTVSSVYSGVETLMKHIAVRHVADIREDTRVKAKCITGRTAGSEEEWDINIPVFEQMEELA